MMREIVRYLSGLSIKVKLPVAFMVIAVLSILMMASISDDYAHHTRAAGPHADGEAAAAVTVRNDTVHSVAKRNDAFTAESLMMAFLIVGITIMMIVPSISAYFIDPVLVLQSHMKSVENGDFSVRVHERPGQDELQGLNRSFNRMVERLDALLNTVTDLKLQEANLMLREKEALIEAMQHQINPHFLYNTLDIIKSIAYLEDVPQIVSMTKGLADFYRYTVANTNEAVTLRDEIQYVRQYLSIIHVRFATGFYSSIAMEEEFEENTAVRLMIQPLVENAVKYGVEANGGQGRLEIRVYRQDDAVMVAVTDDGPGITSEKAETVRSQLEGLSRQVNLEDILQQRVGLVNVHARIVLKFGNSFGLDIRQGDNGGTCTTLRLPHIKVTERQTGSMPM